MCVCVLVCVSYFLEYFSPPMTHLLTVAQGPCTKFEKNNTEHLIGQKNREVVFVAVSVVCEFCPFGTRVCHHERCQLASGGMKIRGTCT